MTDQRQEGGERSTNVQAGRDLTIRQGPSLDEVREVALDVFRKNFLDLRGVAEEVAIGRAEAITNAFLSELQSKQPDSLKSAADPDFQRSMFNAQREQACSGEADLQAALVDLLVDRATQSNRSMQAIVLNEAIVAAPKLTSDQRRAIAMCFIVKYTVFTGWHSLDEYFEKRIRQQFLPVAEGLPTARIDYQHIEYVGGGAIGVGGVTLMRALQHGAPAYFTHGFDTEDIPDELIGMVGDSRVFIPCLRGQERLQIAALTEKELDGIADTVGLKAHPAQLQALFHKGRMSEDEISADLIGRVPEAEQMIERWDGSPLKNLTLTSVGIAIGHGYWRRVTGEDVSLGIWIK